MTQRSTLAGLLVVACVALCLGIVSAPALAATTPPTSTATTPPTSTATTPPTSTGQLAVGGRRVQASTSEATPIRTEVSALPETGLRSPRLILLGSVLVAMGAVLVTIAGRHGVLAT